MILGHLDQKLIFSNAPGAILNLAPYQNILAREGHRTSVCDCTIGGPRN